MAKITWDDKTALYPPWDEDYQYTADNVNETKASVNDLYDIVGAGAETDNKIVVSINTGGSTNKIKNTVEAITDSAVDNTYLVSVRPGIYIEDNFTIPEYVALISEGTDRVTEIQANTTTGTLITVSPHVSVHGFNINGKTSGTAIGITGAGGCKVHDMTISDCDKAISVNNASADIVLSVLDFCDNIGTGLEILAGKVDLLNLDVCEGFTVGTVIDISGSSSVLNITDLISNSSNVTTIIKIEGAVFFNASIIYGEGFYDGIVIDGTGSVVKINNMKLLDAQNDGVRIEPTAVNTDLSMFDTTITGAGNINANFNSTTCTINGNGFTETNKVYIAPGGNLYAYLLDTEKDNEGLNIYGELHVGTSECPTVSSMGNGDSHTRFLCYTTDDDVSFTDVTAEATSPSGSTFTFESTSVGSSIYVANLANDENGNPRYPTGIRTLVETAAVLGTGNFVVQYYNSVSGWLDLNVMETQATGRYYQHGNNIFTHTGSHHIRGDIRLAIVTDPNLVWDKTDPVSYGTDLYWARARIENAITTAPVFEQFKVDVARTEINADGWLEFFGTARPKASLPVTLGAGRELSGSMADSNIWIDQNLGEGLIDNQFNLTTQYWGLSLSLPDDLDTSCGVDVLVAVRGGGSGAVTLQLTTGKISEGDSVYTSNPALGPIATRRSYTDTQSFTAANELLFFQFHVDTYDFLARKNPADGATTPDIVFLTLNANTLPFNVDMVHIENYYYQWSSGGHI